MGRKVTVRDKILETAATLFYNQGYVQTGINQIVAEADIAIGSLYKHFKSKNDLLYSYLEQEDIRFFTTVEEKLAQKKAPREKLIAYIDFRIDQQKSGNCTGCHFIKINAEIGRTDDEVQQLVQKHKEKQKNLIKKLVTEIQPSKNNFDAKQLTEMIFTMIEGGVVAATINGNTRSLEDIKKLVDKLI